MHAYQQNVLHDIINQKVLQQAFTQSEERESRIIIGTHTTINDVPCTVEKTVQHTTTRNITSDGCNREVTGNGFLNNQGLSYSTSCLDFKMCPHLTTSSFLMNPIHAKKKKTRCPKVSSQWHILPLWPWWLGSCRTNFRAPQPKVLQQTPTNLDILLARTTRLTVTENL